MILLEFVCGMRVLGNRGHFPITQQSAGKAMTAMLKYIAVPRADFAVPKRVVLITAETAPVISDPGEAAGDPPSVVDCQEDYRPGFAPSGHRWVAQRPEVADSVEAAAADCFVEVAAAAESSAAVVVAVAAAVDSYLLRCTWRESDGGEARKPALRQ
jgi:hypothetical protein